MTNKDFIKAFFNGDLKGVKHCNHLTAKGDKLYNYDTVMIIIDRIGKTADFNNRKYSATTGRIQSLIEQELANRCYLYYAHPFEHDNFNGWWNWGYQGAPTNAQVYKKRGY